MFCMNTNMPLFFLSRLKKIAIFIRTKFFVKPKYYLCRSSTEKLVLLCWTPLSKFELEWDAITPRFDKSVLQFIQNCQLLPSSPSSSSSYFFVYSSIYFFLFLCLSPPLIFKFKPIWHANFLSFNFFTSFQRFIFYLCEREVYVKWRGLLYN